MADDMVTIDGALPIEEREKVILKTAAPMPEGYTHWALWTDYQTGATNLVVCAEGLPSMMLLNTGKWGRLFPEQRLDD